MRFWPSQPGPSPGIPAGESQRKQYAAKAWNGGTAEDAVFASRSGATIPLSTYSIAPTKVKGKKPLTGTLVGTSPFASSLSGSTINAVVVPVIFNIGGTVFDPTAPNSCDSGYSAVNRFNASPLVTPVPNLTFNGIDVGNVQYTDGFMRAQFWNAIGGSPAYTNPISFSTAAAITITAGADGITSGSACTLMGVVSQAFLNSQIAAQLQALTQSGVISTTKIALFLTSNVVGSLANPPTPPGTVTCCDWGYHSAVGNPPQFYAFFDYKTLSAPDVNITIASHEMAELMMDPLGTNPTPSWGGIRFVSGCQANLEVGDPFTAVPAPITVNGYTYNPQELAFFSWYFNSPTTASLGAGGKFSSNGTFTGPSKPCPPGGTY